MNPSNLDYDGMGNFSRFPPDEKKVKKSLDIWKSFRIFVSTNGERPSKKQVF